jgi:hypothetical protein
MAFPREIPKSQTFLTGISSSLLAIVVVMGKILEIQVLAIVTPLSQSENSVTLALHTFPLAW